MRALNLDGGDVDTATPMGSMVFTVMAALAQMEQGIERERIIDSAVRGRAAGKDLAGRRQAFTDSQIHNVLRRIDGGGVDHLGAPHPRDVPGDRLPADPGATSGEA